MEREKHLATLKLKIENKKTWSDRVADFLTTFFGTATFLVVNTIFFLFWILCNSGVLPGVPVFDPFPYGFLTTFVSLEAIFLSIIVLISQNRTAKIDDLREELDLHINIRAESEITRILNMLDEVHNHLGLGGADDDELVAMKQKIDVEKLKEELIRLREAR